jgi:hypothetical protein
MPEKPLLTALWLPDITAEISNIGSVSSASVKLTKSTQLKLGLVTEVVRNWRDIKRMSLIQTSSRRVSSRLLGGGHI